MIIIAESGSTKTNWLTEDNELFETIGFNPLFFSSEDIYNELIKNERLQKVKDLCTQVFFYGASCSSDARKKIVFDALKKYFGHAHQLKVDHDMNAAAFATYTGEPGIVCILGTGSNSCLYNGQTIYEEVPALGYVLGDEGSGAYFGKKLLAKFLYHELPPATMELLRNDYGAEKEKIFDAVYKQPHANVYLAGFAQALTHSPDKEFMETFVAEGFTDFFTHHVACYPNYQQYPVHFVGSIAYHFKPVLQQVAAQFGCRLGVVDKNPVYSLLQYHLKLNP